MEVVGGGLPAQPERSESFELVTPMSISAVDRGGGNDHADAHASWIRSPGLDPRFSASRTDRQCTHELEQEQEQERLLVVKLSEASSPQV